MNPNAFTASTRPTLKPVPLDVLGWRCDSFEGPSSGLDLHNPLMMASTSHRRCDLKSTKASYSSDGPTVTASGGPPSGCTSFRAVLT